MASTPSARCRKRAARERGRRARAREPRRPPGAVSRLHLEWAIGQVAEGLGRVERLDARGRQLEAARLVEPYRVLVDPLALAHVWEIGAHAVKGALLERHARTGRPLL